ncbi:MAG TPA: lipid II flippase MurJ [Actinomycetota bacterium]|nr:lipid II flippase MurJ [Actinomycetota bacterium]
MKPPVRAPGRAGTSPGPDPQTPPPERGAAVIAGLTAASRGMGLIRTLVATGVLGLTYLGNTYTSTNLMSNLLFDLFAGGALAAVLVPALSAALVGDDPAEAQRSASAFANTVLLVLTPVVLAGIALRGPIMAALTSGVGDPAIRNAERDLGGFFLLLFLPQVWLYGIGLVTTGVLHAHHRFAGPALAPLVSSVVVTASYLAYAATEGVNGQNIRQVSTAGRWILGLGTTAGVAALSLSVLIPAWRLGLRWRPVLRIPPEARRLTRRLLTSAIVAVGMEQVLLGAMLLLGNRVEGGVVAYWLAFTLLELPWAVLAVPIAIAAFPGLAGSAARGDTGEFAERCSAACRNLAVLVFGGTAGILVLAGPGSRLLLDAGVGGHGSAHLLAPAVAAFAPGLLGYGAYALLTRVAYALGDGRSPALGAVAGFGSATVLSFLAYPFFHGGSLIAALAGAFSVGMTLAAALMLYRLSASAGPEAFTGVVATCGRALAAAAAAVGAGLVAGAVLSGSGVTHHVAAVLGAGAATAVVYLGVLHGLGDRQLKRAIIAMRAAGVAGR